MGELTRAAVNKPPSLWSCVICCVLWERLGAAAAHQTVSVRLSAGGAGGGGGGGGTAGFGTVQPGCRERTGVGLSIRQKKRRVGKKEGEEGAMRVT